MKEILLILLFFSYSIKTYSQFEEKKILRKAQRYFLLEDYDRAVENYKMLADSVPDNFKYNYETALLFFYELDKKPKSLSYFENAVKVMPKDSIPQLFLYMGQAYQANGDYDSAINAFKYYRSIDSNFIKVSVTKYIQVCELALELKSKSSGNTKIENLGSIINTEFSEYTSVFLKEGSEMLFTSRRNKNIYDELIEAIYVSKIQNGKFSEPMKIDSLEEFKDLVMDKNEFESIIGVSPDGEELFIYFDPFIYSSKYENGKWTKPVKLSDKINFNFVTTHASITADKQDIYFSCYGKKNTGNIDIYHSKKQADGTWGTAERLPSYINTRNKEDSPDISPDGKILYFASNGLKGMGRYDIFKTEFADSQWTKPVNLGAPINSAGDDIYFHLYLGAEGTFSSNRNGGYGRMDIYKLFIPEELPKTAFKNCEDGKFGNYKVIFDATKSVDPFGTKVYYEWNFGDSSFTTKGLKVSHTYKRPGIYNAYLNVIDSITGMIEKHEKDFKIEIKNVDYINFDCDSVVQVNDSIIFDASKFNIKGSLINDIYWQPEQDTVKQGIILKYKYSSPGTYNVKMKALYNKDDKVFEQCISRNIKVLSKKDFTNYKKSD
ncbi:MAG: PKD domain-containing protein [Chlorobi bacterium]|nr:PKD domain-containing protein [Chlorobiota bacterium]